MMRDSSHVAGLKFVYGLLFLLTVSSGVAVSPWSSSGFITRPQNATIPLGESLVLECVVDRSSEELRPEWTVNGMGLGLTDGDEKEARKMTSWPRYSIVGRQIFRDWSLQISPVSMEDDTVFECQYDKQRAVAHVQVVVAPDKISVVGGPVKSVIEQTDIEISCIVNKARPAAKIAWYDWTDNEITESTYHSRPLPDETKLFTSNSTVRLRATNVMDNKKLRCVAWNGVGDTFLEAEVKFDVSFGPSVTVERASPKLPWEGQRASFKCLAKANPKVKPEAVHWYLDTKHVSSGSFVYTLSNVSKSLNGHSVNCTVSNEYGQASSAAIIDILYEPTFVVHPESQTGDNMNLMNLYCSVDSNPKASYSWTRDNSNMILSSDQNFTFHLTEVTVGSYVCHASQEEYDIVVHSEKAKVLMRGKPKVRAEDVQQGMVGNDVHVNCIIDSVPKVSEVVWKFHEQALRKENSHYRVVTSPLLSGHMSTLIIREALASDFGEYECVAINDYGRASKRITVVEQAAPMYPFVALTVLLGSLALVVLIIICAVVTCRKKGRRGGVATLAPKQLEKQIGMNKGELGDQQEVALGTSHHLRSLLNSHYTESKSGSDTSSLPRSTFSSVDAHFPVERYIAQQDFRRQQPKPDVISFAPLSPLPSQMSDTSSLLLKVADPRMAASYGNSRLAQNDYSSSPYSTFLPCDSTHSSLLRAQPRAAPRRKDSGAFSDSQVLATCVMPPQEETGSAVSSVASSSSIPRLVLRDSCSHFLASIRNREDDLGLKNNDQDGNEPDDSLATPV